MKKLFLTLLTTIIVPTIGLSTNPKVDALLDRQPETLEELRNANPNDIASLKSYDSRKYDIVTFIKNQRQYLRDTCWSYATMAASETSILREGLYDNPLRSLDFSELNHAYITKNNDPKDNPLNITDGDYYRAGYEQYNSGYTLSGSSNRLTNWVSPNFEPYREDDYNPQMTEVPYLLEDYITVDANDINDIKLAISKYGAVTCAYTINDWHEDYYYYNSNIENDRFDGTKRHAVTIVGWDDTIDKNKYKKPSTVDGGWIVKNSWGTSHKEGDGYFILSYDSKITDVYAYDYAPKEKYDNNYYYDSYTYRDNYINTNPTSAAIFPARKGSLNKKEVLKAINVSIINTISPKKNSPATISAKIYTNVNGDISNIYSQINNPIKGNLVATVSRTVDHEGSYTIELPKEIEIEKNSYFSIVVDVQSENNKYKVALSAEGDESKDLTFYNDNGVWKNASTIGNPSAFRIKGFTKLVSRTETAQKDINYTEVKLNSNEKYRYGSVPEFMDVTVTSENNQLVKDKDYKVLETTYNFDPNFTSSSSDYDQIGKGVVKIIGINDWHGETEITFPLYIGFIDTTILGEEIDYKTIKITTDSSSSTYNDITLPTGWFFVYPNDKLDVGENRGNYLDYRGEDAKYYRRTFYEVIVNKTESTIPKININDANVGLTNNSFIYTGNNITPKVEVTYNNNKLLENLDYTLTYDNNINVGIATITIKGIGKYSATKSTTFTITKRNISDSSITYNNSYKYTSNEINPTVTIILNGKELKLDVDYKVTYSNNINVGNATITITGINNYDCTINKTFTITKANNNITNFEIINGTPTANSDFGDIIYKYYSDINCLKEIDKPTTPGIYYIKAIVLETDNYDAFTSQVLEFRINDVITPEPEKPDIPNPEPNKPLEPTPEDNNLNRTNIILITVIPSSLVLVILTTILIIIKKKRK